MLSGLFMDVALRIFIIFGGQMFISEAYAQAAGEAAKQPGFAEQIPFMLAIFFIFYFFLIRPQAKKAKQHQSLLNELKRGEEVLTSGGVVGKIDGLNDSFVTLEVATGVKIKVARKHISSKLKEQQS